MMNKLIGMTLGQYEIREFEKNNGIIKTYRAYQPRLERFVTLQTLDEEFLNNPFFRKGFARGAAMIASFEHPNIVPVIDFGEGHGIPYIVIRAMQGGLLRDRLLTGVLAFQEAAGVVRQIGSALEYVHSRDKVHGDPSTLNIGFDHSGSAYLVDFIYIGTITEGPYSGLIGSKRYMSPERWRGKSPTPASDQYALGAIAYHLLTGHAPFEAQELMDYMDKHLDETVSPPQIYRTEIPMAVNEVFLRSMAKTPDERYPTILDFARAFEKALNTVQQHVFISYSRRDTVYAHQLREHLQNNNFNVWIDDAIEHGDQWFLQIHEAIKTCAAFLVVMTEDAENSEWVHKEILLAKRYKRPIFPLLLNGHEFAILIDLQFADVRKGRMPENDFHRRLHRTIFGTA
jgi:serine/threonine protein kinase